MAHMELEQNYKCKDVLNASKIKTCWNVEKCGCGTCSEDKKQHIRL